ncbi:MAG: MotA/TolQ/ExbB proton channel family protein [Phycisphaerae bacterium]|nr:MotA/TolQ/ExbB proton channel family protein [Phycisphaerae bacterium]
MDISSLIGVVIGLICLGLVGYHSSHGHWAMYYSQEGVLMVFGGSLSVLFMAMPLEKVKCVIGFLRRFMFNNKSSNPVETIKLLGRLGEKARREGILSLQPDIEKITDPFLKNGLTMALDGVDPNDIESTLRMEIMAMQERHKAGKKFFDLVKLYGPGWGLVGTLIGQIGMFGQLGGSVEAMGKSLAVAVVATMYGTIVANAIAGPIGDKLGLRSSEEILNREMIVQGVLSIQAGDNPRVTLEKMMAFIPNNSRVQLKAAA